MGELSIDLSVSFSLACHCCHEECGVPIVMPASMEKDLRRSHNFFHCVNGHSQHFSGTSEEERLRKLIDKEREWRIAQERETERQREFKIAAQHRERAQKGVVTRLKNRAAVGLCPCCNRSFQNLKRHMEIKHPEQIKASGRDV